MSAPSNPEGLLPVDKPAGPTSHDMVAQARRSLGLRRVGHTGTLDPFASGLLLLCLGRATRLAEYLTALPKEYVATARLGIRTSTDDPEGDVVGVSDEWCGLRAEDVEAAVMSFRGTSAQVPPVYSAKKVRGSPAHRRIRRGETVELEPVSISIDHIEVEAVALPDVRFRVRCSAGTYVRALARDLGEQLGVGAHLTALRRLSIGRFSLDGALSPHELDDPIAVERAWIPPVDALQHMHRLAVSPDAARRIVAGQGLDAAEFDGTPDDEALAVTLGDHLLAVAERREGMIRPRKVFPPDA